MAITAEQYIAEVRSSLPEAHKLLDRLAQDHEPVNLVWQVNNDLTFLLLWAWRAGDRDTCDRILGVMEQGMIDTNEGDDAPVWNSVGIGVTESVHRDLAPDDFAAFIEIWPPAMHAQGLRMHATRWDEDDDDYWDGDPDSFQLPPGFRLRWALRHPIRSRLGTRITFAG